LKYHQFSREESAYRIQLNQGFSFLCFDELLEQDFRRSLSHDRARQLRLSLILMCLFGLLFLTIDYFGNGPGFSNPMVPVRSLISGSLMLAMISVCYGRLPERWLEPLSVAVALNFGPVSFLANQLFGVRDGVPTPLVIYACITFFIFFSFGLRFWQATAISSLLFVCHMTATVAGSDSIGTRVLYPVVLLLMANVVAAMAAYNLEYNERQRFLMEWELKFQANHDQLTGLRNRRALMDHMARAWSHCNREQQRLALVVIDIDFFKKFNDTYGHIKGDQCLAEVGRLLRKIGQRPLDLVARYGGEEFAVLLPNCSTAQAERIMQQFRQKLAEAQIRHSTSTVSPCLTVSIGLVSVLPGSALMDFNKLINEADKALYEAKGRGRNCMVLREDTLQVPDVASNRAVGQMLHLKAS
jgi:diguanylate cyclase (GGDEF)-like protein